MEVSLIVNGWIAKYSLWNSIASLFAKYIYIYGYYKIDIIIKKNQFNNYNLPIGINSGAFGDKFDVIGTLCVFSIRLLFLLRLLVRGIAIWNIKNVYQY